MFPMTPELVLLALCCALFGAAAVFDLVSRRIPNTIPIALSGLFLLQVALVGHRGMAPFWLHLVTGAVLLVVGVALFAFGQLGPADGKLMAAAGLWIGPWDIGEFLLGVGVLGLALGLFSLLPFDATRRLRTNLPFAVAIAPPAVAVLMLQAFPAAGSS